LKEKERETRKDEECIISLPPTHTHPSKTKNRIFLIYVVVASAATTAKKKKKKKKKKILEKRVEECVQLTNQNKRHIRAASGLGG